MDTSVRIREIMSRFLVTKDPESTVEQVARLNRWQNLWPIMRLALL
jgi:hypothetical protein